MYIGLTSLCLYSTILWEVKQDGSFNKIFLVKLCKREKLKVQSRFVLTALHFMCYDKCVGWLERAAFSVIKHLHFGRCYIFLFIQDKLIYCLNNALLVFILTDIICLSLGYIHSVCYCTAATGKGKHFGIVTAVTAGKDFLTGDS